MALSLVAGEDVGSLGRSSPERMVLLFAPCLPNQHCFTSGPANQGQKLMMTRHVHVTSFQTLIAQLSLSSRFCRLPVVVMPERDIFGRLLLYKTAVQDHLPSNYVRVLQELKESYECESAA